MVNSSCNQPQDGLTNLFCTAVDTTIIVARISSFQLKTACSVLASSVPQHNIVKCCLLFSGKFSCLNSTPLTQPL